MQPVVGAQASPERDEIKARIQTIRDGASLMVDGQTVSSELVLPTLYERRDYKSVWTDPQAVSQLIQVLEQVDTDGLDRDDYHVSAIEALRADKPGNDPAAAAELDILMTDALIRLGYHLLAGKVDAEALDANWNMTSTIGDLDTILSMAKAIETARIPELVEELRPDHPIYARLRQGLAHYRLIQQEGGWPQVPPGPTLKPGMTDGRVVALRNRLAVTGELADTGNPSDTYDESLEAAVKTFQERHNLAADGAVGPATLDALNVPVGARIDQIKINLERARWVLHDLPDEVVIADIAGFRVSYRRDGKTVWSTRAQVGKPYRKTPVFKDRIRYLEINPTWTVPPGILRKDILPRLKKDPAYLQQKDMRVLTQDGKPVDPAGIDWSRYPANRFPYLIRQNPGPANALGRVKFMFPNKHLVYLHDTPSRSLFDRDQRAFSSGCIRVENPFELAVLLLGDPQWTEARMADVVASKKTTTVRLNEPVTVILMYWTVNVTADGHLVFKADVYDRDPAVLAGLNKPFSFRKAPILDEQARQ
jgi:murein L,D-transpeptidase YcbB/YkuD